MANIFEESIEKIKKAEEKLNAIENKDIQKIVIDICVRYPAAIVYAEEITDHLSIYGWISLGTLKSICEECSVHVYGLDSDDMYGWSVPIYGDLLFRNEE